MATTTIRIDDELKMRVAVAAQIAGKTTHAFVLDAISETVEQVERDTQFHAIAQRRWANIVATGKTVPWDAARKTIWLPGRLESAHDDQRRESRVLDARQSCRVSKPRRFDLFDDFERLLDHIGQFRRGFCAIASRIANGQA